MLGLMNNKIEETINVIQGIKNKRVLVVGDMLLDEYLYGEVNKVSTGIKLPIIEKQNSIYRLGGASNIAANIAGISNSVSIIGKCGDDDGGKTITQLLKDAGIKLFHMKAEKTIVKQRIYVDKQQIARIDDNCVCSNDIDIFDSYINGGSYDVIVVADYQYGFVDTDILQRCIKKAKEDDVPILLTSRCVKKLDFTGISALVLNEDEATDLIKVTDSKIEFRDEMFEDMDYFITLGDKGLCYKNMNEELFVETKKLHAINVSGAGDTVFAILAILYGENISNEEMLRIANIGGGLAVSSELTYTMTSEELIEALYDLEVKNEYTNKIVKCEMATYIVEAWKQGKKKVVFTNGCYDLLHLGHIQSLKIAKEKGDKLVVAVNSDASIKRLKGNCRPINTLEERLTALSYLDMIDMIIPFEEDTAIDVIKSLKPDIYVKGEEYKHRVLREAKYVDTVEYIPMVKGISTTNVIHKITEAMEGKND